MALTKRFIAITLWLALMGWFPASNAVESEGDRALRDRVRVQVQLGLGYMRSGRKELAQSNLDRAVAIAPNSPSAHAAMAVFKEYLGDYEAAETHFRKAISLSPSRAGVRNDYGNYLCRRGQYADADNQFRSAMADRLYASAEVLYMNAGLCSLRKGDLGLAEIYFRKALQRNPVFPQALEQLAAVSLKVRRYSAVLDYLGRYRSIARDTPSTLNMSIDALLQLGRREEAGRLRVELRRQFPASVLKTTKLTPSK